MSSHCTGCVVDAQLAAANERIKELEAERDEADRAAGSARRELSYVQDSMNKRKDWLRAAKREWGVDDTVSFDDVWAEAVKMRAQLTAEREVSDKLKKALLEYRAFFTSIPIGHTALAEVAAMREAQK